MIFYKRFSLRPLILSAGMPRSGSTLLFNLLRLILEQKYGDQLSSGWIGDFRALPRAKAYLIKTHQLPEKSLWRPRRVYYSYRDIRSAAVSEMRMWGKDAIPKKQFDWYVKHYNIAKKRADIMIKYEDLIGDPKRFIITLAGNLNIDVDADDVARRLAAVESPSEVEADIALPKTRYSSKTLLHINHRTGTRDDDWREMLPEDLISWIHDKYDWWFSECGYPSR